MDDKIREISLSQFHYLLPDDRIARYPLVPRDSSKLLVFKQGNINHLNFTGLADQIPAESLLVFNDTKVIPARSHFRKASGAVIEILFLQPEEPTNIINDAVLVTGECVWECMIGNKKRWKKDEILSNTVTIDGEGILVHVSYSDYDNNLVRLYWNSAHTFLDIIQALGQIPLPPYLKRETETSDLTTYQTVYAHHEGAVAAPTAGLHFTESIFDQLEQKGISRAFLTLHVGAGTFQPIKSETITDHRMHAEQMVFSRDFIVTLIQLTGKLIPVGTTSLRSLESLYWYGIKLLKDDTADFNIEKLYPYSFAHEILPTAKDALEAIIEQMDIQGKSEITGSTEIFIFPGYRFKLCDALITNYHQPGSTLILLIAAFTGSHWREIYQEALSQDYRFLSYGDSSLLWRIDE